MKRFFPLMLLCLGLAANRAAGADDWLDDLADRLSFATADGRVRAKLGGSLELEGYAASTPVGDLIFSDQKFLFNPRLALYLDVQAGPRVYFFTQLRVDRGFDPSDDSLDARLDEYALRVELWKLGRLNVQVGKFATVVGNWVARHDAWDNPFITAPLLYDNLTGVWNSRPVPSADWLLAWAHVQPASAGEAVYADKYLRLPVIWGPVYAQGVAVSGAWKKFTYAAELKNAALASRPEEWRQTGWDWSRPNLGARVAYRPDERWEDLVFLYSDADYLDQAAAALVPPGLDRHDYRQRVVAQDLRFAWHHFQFWAEACTSRFAVPGVGDLSTFAYYLEAKYKFTPQFSAALRWNQQHFGEVQDSSGQNLPWGRQVWRIDVAPAYRFSAHTQLKFQYSLRHDDPSPDKYTQSIAVQWQVRF